MHKYVFIFPMKKDRKTLETSLVFLLNHIWIGLFLRAAIMSPIINFNAWFFEILFFVNFFQLLARLLNYKRYLFFLTNFCWLFFRIYNKLKKELFLIRNWYTYIYIYFHDNNFKILLFFLSSKKHKISIIIIIIIINKFLKSFVFYFLKPSSMIAFSSFESIFWYYVKKSNSSTNSFIISITILI
jgi:hypothetical protein